MRPQRKRALRRLVSYTQSQSLSSGQQNSAAIRFDPEAGFAGDRDAFFLQADDPERRETAAHDPVDLLVCRSDGALIPGPGAPVEHDFTDVMVDAVCGADCPGGRRRD